MDADIEAILKLIKSIKTTLWIEWKKCQTEDANEV